MREEKYGRVLFLSFSGYDEDTNTTSENDNDHPFQKTHTVSSLEAGEKEKKSEYYDCIYIGWYDGSNYYQGSHLPYPNVENIVIADDWSNFSYAHFSLRINDRQVRRGQIIHNIEPKMKTTFKFLSQCPLCFPHTRQTLHLRKNNCDLYRKRYVAVTQRRFLPNHRGLKPFPFHPFVEYLLAGVYVADAELNDGAVRYRVGELLYQLLDYIIDGTETDVLNVGEYFALEIGGALDHLLLRDAE